MIITPQGPLIRYIVQNWRYAELAKSQRAKKNEEGSWRSLHRRAGTHFSLAHTHTHDLGCGSEPARRVPKANARAAAAAASVGLGPGLGLGLGLEGWGWG